VVLPPTGPKRGDVLSKITFQDLPLDFKLTAVACDTSDTLIVGGFSVGLNRHLLYRLRRSDGKRDLSFAGGTGMLPDSLKRNSAWGAIELPTGELRDIRHDAQNDRIYILLEQSNHTELVALSGAGTVVSAFADQGRFVHYTHTQEELLSNGMSRDWQVTLKPFRLAVASDGSLRIAGIGTAWASGADFKYYLAAMALTSSGVKKWNSWSQEYWKVPGATYALGTKNASHSVEDLAVDPMGRTAAVGRLRDSDNSYVALLEANGSPTQTLPQDLSAAPTLRSQATLSQRQASNGCWGFGIEPVGETSNALATGVAFDSSGILYVTAQRTKMRSATPFVAVLRYAPSTMETKALVMTESDWIDAAQPSIVLTNQDTVYVGFAESAAGRAGTRTVIQALRPSSLDADSVFDRRVMKDEASNPFLRRRPGGNLLVLHQTPTPTAIELLP